MKKQVGTNMDLGMALAAAKNGDADAAFKAANIMEVSGYAEYYIQCQLVRARELGSANAMFSLGMRALENGLIDMGISKYDDIYYCTRDASVPLLVDALNHDSLEAIYVIGELVGTGWLFQQSKTQSERMLEKAKSLLSAQQIEILSREMKRIIADYKATSAIESIESSPNSVI